MAFDFNYQPPWQQMFGPINQRWQNQADASQQAVDNRPRGIFGLGGGRGLGSLIPNGFLGHVANRNLFGRPIYPVEPGTTMQATLAPPQSTMPSDLPEGWGGHIGVQNGRLTGFTEGAGPNGFVPVRPIDEPLRGMADYIGMGKRRVRRY